jgi:hypothetical protein
MAHVPQETMFSAISSLNNGLNMTAVRQVIDQKTFDANSFCDFVHGLCGDYTPVDWIMYLGNDTTFSWTDDGQVEIKGSFRFHVTDLKTRQILFDYTLKNCLIET